ncbi:MAG: ABC transporter permease, partial [Thalassovita sp.]|nr:ABC transporter permease [Thalassovita sp.]
MGWIVFGFLAWLVGWRANVFLARLPKSRATGLAVPVIFGVTVVIIWECAVHGVNINPVLLPAPSAIAVRFAASTGIL